MAIGWIYFDYLQRRNIFPAGGARILDIGAQHIFDIPVDGGVGFLRQQGNTLDDASLRARVEAISRRATWPPGKTAGVFLHEFLEGTNLEYTGFDIFPGPKVEIFDLNYQSLMPSQRETFDVIFNFGTTEHVFNQFNCFKVIHEAARPGAYMFHQLPCVGWMDHGYWVYSPRLFIELADANGYEVCDMWCSGPLGDYGLLERLTYAPSARDAALPQNHADSWESTRIPNGLINVLLRKQSAGPFRVGLDVTTSAGGPDEAVIGSYFPEPGAAVSRGRQRSVLRLFTAREIAREFLFRIKRKLGLGD